MKLAAGVGVMQPADLPNFLRPSPGSLIANWLPVLLALPADEVWRFGVGAV